VVVAYLAKGRMKLPKDAAVFNVDDQVVEPAAAAPVQPASSGDGATAQTSGSPSLQ
jgi:hypothetical protein